MFGSGKKIENLKAHIRGIGESIEERIEIVDERHFALHHKYRALLEHLGIEEYNQPKELKFRKKDDKQP